MMLLSPTPAAPYFFFVWLLSRFSFSFISRFSSSLRSTRSFSFSFHRDTRCFLRDLAAFPSSRSRRRASRTRRKRRFRGNICFGAESKRTRPRATGHWIIQKRDGEAGLTLTCQSQEALNTDRRSLLGPTPGLIPRRLPRIHPRCCY